MYINLIDQLVHSTVRIECVTQYGSSSGSGYFFAFLETGESHVPCIITNKHVISGALRGKFHLTIQGQDGLPKLGEHISCEFDNFESMWLEHPDPAIDLAIFPIAPLVHQARNQNINFHFTCLNKSVIATEELLFTLPTMEEIVMIGYPNGIWDAKHNLPIIRRGITATHPKLPYNGQPIFVIDAACFPGSSGSPVFLVNVGSYVDATGTLYVGNRIALLGTLYAGPQHSTTGEIIIVEVPTDTKPVSISSIPNNLGFVIHASKVLDFEMLLQH
ncbi:trypsin-like peptidase domain-containing protein [Aliterella atlantica]|uniref:Zinc chelation protein SecC n=1 Tax=Aliterella atlantica CENA595 TaxID=1618023 RepID=A0A0D8ZQV4_9CYAN|nr:trypsin-like peptidase domain-containing protein [Aliterella atlantica]KJH69606.1 zinc chelation protein SecC [Aliterella atlantica CENA595]